MFLQFASRSSTVLLLTSLIVLPQSYLAIKAPALALFVVVHFMLLAMKEQVFITARDFLFYALLCVVAITWSIVGVAHGASTESLLANLRLYLGWSVIYFALLSMLRNAGRTDVLHLTFVISVYLIVAINLIALADAGLDLGLLGEPVQKELGLTVELHGGYVRFGANNIASLFFLIGYLIAYKCFNVGRADRAGTVALLLGLLLVALSGRRALWLAICMVPAITFMIASFSGTVGRLTMGARRAMLLYVLGIGLASMAFVTLSSTSGLDFLEYLKSAFSTEDERSIQARYLIEAFKEHPLIGSGFGGYAGYTRSLETPWLYELTYYQILFNLGLLGAFALLAGLAYFLHLATNAVREANTKVAQYTGILVGFLTILIGSHSNPYMQFFDSMLFIMFFVMLAGSAGPIVWLRGPRRVALAS